MLDLWNNASLALFDFLLGWMLYLPSDLILLGLALITAGLMALVRPLTTNQELLRRIDDDRRRLKELTRAAKVTGQRCLLANYQKTANTLALRKLAAEWKPLAVVIVPVAMLATWAMFRVEFHPPAEDETVQLALYLRSPTAEGEITHIVPTEGLEATGWVQQVALEPVAPSWWDNLLVWCHLTEPRKPEPDVVAVWSLKGKARTEPYPLLLRFKDRTVRRELLVGQTTYSPSIMPADEDDPVVFLTQSRLREVKLFNIVPGFGGWFPAWIVGYLVIVVPLVFVLKWVLRIY